MSEREFWLEYAQLRRKRTLILAALLIICFLAAINLVLDLFLRLFGLGLPMLVPLGLAGVDLILYLMHRRIARKMRWMMERKDELVTEQRVEPEGAKQGPARGPSLEIIDIQPVEARRG